MSTNPAAAIRRGQAAALAELNQLQSSGLHQLQQQYQLAYQELSQYINYANSSAGIVRLSSLQVIINHINTLISALSEQQQQIFTRGITSAANTNRHISQTINQVIDHTSAATAIWQLAQNDGLQLSQRLWRINQQNHQALTNAIQLAIIRGDSAYQAAQNFMQQGIATPNNVQSDQNAASASNLTRISREQLLTNGDSGLAQVQRVYQTETTRAQTLAYINSTDNVEGVVAYRFNLSKAHRKKDICDLHAGANLYGLGKGVYPKDVINRIYPAHPNTTSFITAVFREEITKEDKKTDKNRIQWLKKQSKSTQEAVLGKQKAIWLREGKLTERTINSKVSTLKKRFDQQE